MTWKTISQCFTCNVFFINHNLRVIQGKAIAVCFGKRYMMIRAENGSHLQCQSKLLEYKEKHIRDFLTQRGKWQVFRWKVVAVFS